MSYLLFSISRVLAFSFFRKLLLTFSPLYSVEHIVDTFRVIHDKTVNSVFFALILKSVIYPNTHTQAFSFIKHNICFLVICFVSEIRKKS